MHELHVRGGLGDFFCYMLSPDPCMDHHPLRGLTSLLLRGEEINLHIYSDNPDSANLFEIEGGRCIHVHRHKYHEYKELISTIPYDYCIDNVMGFFTVFHRSISPIVIIHPFTTTKEKEWLSIGNNKEILVEVIEKLAKDHTIFVLGKDTPELYFGGKTSFACREYFNMDIPNVHCFRNEDDTPLAPHALSLMRNANFMICIDSAYMMARYINPHMKVISLLPSFYRDNDKLFDHYYYQGLDKYPNEYLYYDEVTVDALVNKVKF